MKATFIIALTAAALGGALVATTLNGEDEPTEAVAIERPATEQPAAGAAAAGRPHERPAPRHRQERPGGTGNLYLEPEDRPIGRAELNSVRDAALAAAGGGIVTDVDRSDDLGVAYEVEVVQSGQEIEVRLDDRLDPVAQSYDD